MEATKHKPVLFNEALEWLAPQSGETVIDATLGGGGHARAFLTAVGDRGRVIAFDADLEAIERFRDATNRDPKLRAALNEERLILVHANFAMFEEEVARLGVERIDRVFADLGFSSDQIEDSERGFSFLHDGPLDMRLDQRGGMTAADIVNRRSEHELETIIRTLGEESRAKRIARAIVEARKEAPLLLTRDLVSVIERVVPRDGHTHPATKTFQALRIAVNDELGNLEKFLKVGIDCLGEGGRIGIISFHSGEDRIVKDVFRREERGCICPPMFPVCVCGRTPSISVLTKNPVVPSAKEIRDNPRARSAKLRVAKRVVAD